MKNVCHIISGDLWAGAESQVFSLLRKLSEYKELKIIVILFNSGILADKIKLNKIKNYVIDEKKNSAIRVIYKIQRIMRKEKIQIIHTHGYKETFFAGIISMFNRNNLLIRTHHGKGIIGSGFKHYFIEKINAKLLCKNLIAVSNDLKKFLLQRNLGRNSIKVIHNGIYEKDIKLKKDKKLIRKELNIPDVGIIFGTLGRLVSVKGHKYLLEGAKKVIAKYPQAYFIIAGNGELMNIHLDWINRECLGNNIKFIGFRDDPYDILNSFDIFVLTSLHEGIPMVLLEAMFLEKPIIATKVGGIPEIISDGENGILIPSKNSDAFADACLSFIENTMKSPKSIIAKNAKRDVINKLSVDKVAKEVIKMYYRM